MLYEGRTSGDERRLDKPSDLPFEAAAEGCETSHVVQLDIKLLIVDTREWQSEE